MQKFYGQSLWVILTLVLAFILRPGMNVSASGKDMVAVEITEKALSRVIDKLLPLEVTVGKNLSGLWIQSIDRLDLKKNLASFDVKIVGKDVEFASRVGQQIAKISLGSVEWSFHCRTTIAYDADKGILWIKPEMEEILPEGKEVDVERTAAKFFTSLSVDGYPVELRRLDPLQFDIDGRRVALDLVVTNIFIAQRRIVIQTRPTLSEVEGK